MPCPHMIEVHDLEEEQSEICINIDNIINYHVDSSGSTIIEVTDGSYYSVKETYEEIKQLMKDAGCSITKPDPRLDHTHPLTINDLKDMVDEPVWNSNLSVWMLVYSCNEKEVGLALSTGFAGHYNAEELVKYPLYRMKQ